MRWELLIIILSCLEKVYVISVNPYVQNREQNPMLSGVSDQVLMKYWKKFNLSKFSFLNLIVVFVIVFTPLFYFYFDLRVVWNPRSPGIYSVKKLTTELTTDPSQQFHKPKFSSYAVSASNKGWICLCFGINKSQAPHSSIGRATDV